MDEERKSCLFCKKTFSNKGNCQRHLTIWKGKKLVEEQNITITNQEIKEQIYKRICEATISQYKKDSLDTDSLVTDSEVIGD